MSRQYAAIPLHIPFDMKSVRAFVQHKDSLYVAFDDGLINSIPLKIDTKCNVKLGEKSSFKINIEGYEISQMKSFYDKLLVQIKSKDGSMGVLVALDQGLTRINDNADLFVANAFTQSKTIAVVSGKSLIIIEYDGQSFNTKFRREYFETILGVAMVYPNVCIETRSKMVVINIEKGITNEIKMFGVSNPYLLARDTNTFFSYSALSAMVVDLSLNADLLPVSFSVPCTDHTRCGPLFASMSPECVTIYDFKHHNGSIEIKNCKRIATYNTNFLLATDKDICILRDMTEAFEHISAGSIDVAAHSLPNQGIDALSALFEMIWNNGKMHDALQLLTLKEFENIIIDVLTIFDFIVFSPHLPNSGRLSAAHHTSDPEIAKEFVEILFEIRNKLTDSTKILINTAIVEILSVLNDNSRLYDFFDTNPLFQVDSLKEFFSDAKGVPYAIYLYNTGYKDAAISVLKENSAFDIAAKVIAKSANDWKFVEENISWLFEKSPIQACIVLSSSLIDLPKARSYVLTQYPRFYLRFLKEALNNKNVLTKKTFIDELSTGLINILTSVKDKSFKREEASFLSCMINNKDSTIEQIEKEVSDELINVLRKFHNEVDIEALMKNVSKIQIPRVQVEIYTAANCLKEALDIVWKDGLKECVKFCRECENKQKAFSRLFNIIRDRSEDPIKDIVSTIEDNIEDVDLADALSNIDGNKDLSEVNDIIFDLFKKISMIRRDKELDAAFAQSRAENADYTRATIESGCVSLNSESVCAACGKPLGYQYVVRTPDGALYHYKCLPTKK